MNGSGSAGNPSAASSCSLPAHANEGTLQPELRITESQEEEQQSRESVSLPGSQSPGETEQAEEEADRQDSPTEKNPEYSETSIEDEPNSDQLQPEKLFPDQTKLDPLPASGDSGLVTDQKNLGEPLGPKHEQEPGNFQDYQSYVCLPPSKVLTVSTVEKEVQNEMELHSSESIDQKRDAPSKKLLMSSSQRLQDHPDPPHQNTQKAPPPPAHQQRHLDPPAKTSALSPPAPPLTIEVFCDQMQSGPAVPSLGGPKLCGFLLKQGGPLRTWKQRWFTYEDKKNQLFYYRTPNDVMPLGRVELSGATFTYPLKAEPGTFHIRTPDRTFILKAVTQELMLYWLQQLQVKRWQHRQMSTCSDPTNNNNNNIADDFLPVLKSPVGLVGEEAASVPMPRTPLTNMSLKHPLIEIQNSVHSLRKRSSQDWSQSVFHVEAPPWIPPNAADSNNTTSTQAQYY